ncbi:hypothetical protein DFH27DRAFT_55664 [Peziza echinospora]|nr:hypothetical protein DFH27DRAFT_55664 [Peziza echinospora]
MRLFELDLEVGIFHTVFITLLIIFLNDIDEIMVMFFSYVFGYIFYCILWYMKTRLANIFHNVCLTYAFNMANLYRSNLLAA